MDLNLSPDFFGERLTQRSNRKCVCLCRGLSTWRLEAADHLGVALNVWGPAEASHSGDGGSDGGAGEKEGSRLPEHCTPVLRICGWIHP